MAWRHARTEFWLDPLVAPAPKPCLLTGFMYPQYPRMDRKQQRPHVPRLSPSAEVPGVTSNAIAREPAAPRAFPGVSRGLADER